MAGMPRKPIVWVGSSLKDLQGFPKAVKRDVGTALDWAETGRLHPSARRMHGHLRDVIESRLKAARQWHAWKSGEKEKR